MALGKRRTVYQIQHWSQDTIIADVIRMLPPQAPAKTPNLHWESLVSSMVSFAQRRNPYFNCQHSQQSHQFSSV